MKEALKLALEALECIPESGSMLGAFAEEKRVAVITTIKAALAAPVQEPVAWMPITEPYPPGDELDILMGDGSILCAVLPQADGDLWWGGSGTGEKFIDPQYTNVTHWRIHSDTTPPAAQRQWVGLTDEEFQFIYDNCLTPSNLIDMAEAKLKEKNHD